MPKSKVRKKVAVSTATSSAKVNSAKFVDSRVKVAGPSSPFYIGVMLGLMLLGLAWLVGNYLWGGTSGILGLGNWNFAIGFALIIGGLLMTMRWR